MNYPIVLGDDDIAAQFGGMLGYPTSWFISRDGRMMKQRHWRYHRRRTRKRNSIFALAGPPRLRTRTPGVTLLSPWTKRISKNQSDAALEDLRETPAESLAINHVFEVEGGSGKLEIQFEDEHSTRFIISPNSPVRQIWISALTTSFKLGWSETAQAFVLEKTGETLTTLMGRIMSQQLGTAVQV